MLGKILLVRQEMSRKSVVHLWKNELSARQVFSLYTALCTPWFPPLFYFHERREFLDSSVSWVAERLRNQCLMSSIWAAGVCFHVTGAGFHPQHLAPSASLTQGSSDPCTRATPWVSVGHLVYTYPAGFILREWCWNGKEWILSKTGCA